MPVKQDIPYQLLGWHEHVAFTRDKYPDMPYKEILQKASATYHKGSGASAHNIAGRRKPAPKRKAPVKRRAGLLSAHDIAGKRKAAPKRKAPVKRRAAGTISDVANTVAAVSSLLGLGRMRKPAARKPAAKKSAAKKRVAKR